MADTIKGYMSSGDTYDTAPVELNRDLRMKSRWQPYEFLRSGYGPTGRERVTVRFNNENNKYEYEVMPHYPDPPPEQNREYNWDKHDGPYVSVQRRAGGTGWERRDYGPLTAEERYKMKEGYGRVPRSVTPIPLDLVDTRNGNWRPEHAPPWLAGITPATPAAASPAMPSPSRPSPAMPSPAMPRPAGASVTSPAPVASPISSSDRNVARLDQLLRSDYPAIRRPANSGFNPAAFMSNVYASGALAPEGTAARLSQGSSATGEGGSPPDRDQAYRDALNTRFQGQNMDGTTFDRLPSDSEAQGLAGSSFRESGRQVMPRITTNSTFPEQVNPNVGTPTVRDPYGGPSQYGWQGRDALYGNRTYRSVTRDPRTGQTYITNFSTPGNAPVPQQSGMSPTVDPKTGETVERPEVRAAQQAFMDRLRYKQPKDNGGYMDPTKMLQVYSDRGGTDVAYDPNTKSLVDQFNNTVSPADMYNRLQSRIYRDGMNDKKAAWGRIIANRQAQNAGFANAYQAEMFRDIMMAQANRGRQPLINVQQGIPQQDMAQQGVSGQGGVPMRTPQAGTNPGGVSDRQWDDIQQISRNRSPQDVYAYMKSVGANDRQINQVLFNLYPNENRAASEGGGSLPRGLAITPDGREDYSPWGDPSTSFPATQWLYGNLRSVAPWMQKPRETTGGVVPGTGPVRPPQIPVSPATLNPGGAFVPPASRFGMGAR